MGRIDLSAEQVRQQFPLIYKIFFAGERQQGESLHDYFTRKKLKCFCPDCTKARKQPKTDEDKPIDLSNLDFT